MTSKGTMPIELGVNPFRSTATTVAVWTYNNRDVLLQAANLGDSTAFLWDGQECVQLTVDHKPTTPSERERIQAMGVTLGEHQTRFVRLKCGVNASKGWREVWLFPELSAILNAKKATLRE